MTTDDTHTRPRVHLRPWAPGDHWLLARTNTPEMTEHLGGPETEAQLAVRHSRYLRTVGDAGCMFVIELMAGSGTTGGADPGEGTRQAVGSIGYWEHDWRGETVYETGWGVLPEFQGRGLAASAAREVIADARRRGRRRSLHAFPSVGHPASNAVCRKAGFTLLGECAFEYPKGHPITSNDWAVALTSTR